jgi:hypothetical protein
MKQTAVEFYRNNLMALVSTGKTDFKTEPEIFEKAKEMEKEQINKACYDGYYQEEMMNTKEYYDKTYNQEV